MSTLSVALSQFTFYDPSFLHSILGKPRSRFLFLQGLVNIILSYELLFGQSPLLSPEARELSALGLWALTLPMIGIPAIQFRQPWFASALLVVDTVLITVAIYVSGNASSHLYFVFFLLMLVAASVRTLTMMLNLSVVLCAGYGILLWQGVLVSGVISSGHVLGIPVLLITAVFYGLTLESVEVEREQRIALAERVSSLRHEEVTLRRSHEGLLQRSSGLREDLGRMSRAVAAGKRREEGLQLRLDRAQKMEAVARLAGVIARDFDALLRVIGIQTGELLKKAGGQHELRRHAERILAAGDRASVLTGRLQQFSDSDSFQQEAVPLNAMLEELQGLLRTLMTQEVGLQLRLDPSVRSVKGDRGQLELVVMHLVANARDAMPRGGCVTLETKRVSAEHALASQGGSCRQRFVKLAVGDTGCGMTEEIEARLFEPFFTTKEHGSGHGLATVYGIVKQCGGAIQIRTRPGRGTLCEVFLAEVGGSLQTLEEPTRSRTAPRNQTVLLVDEDELARRLTAGTLRRHGYDVLEARTAVEALLVAQRYTGSIHLVVSPAMMHDISGRELTDRLALQHPGLKVIYMGGYADTIFFDRQMDGAGFLKQPLAQKEVVGKVAEALASSCGG